MTIKGLDNDIIPSKTEGEEEMTTIHLDCTKPHARKPAFVLECHTGYTLRGIITCTEHKNSFPIVVEEGVLRELSRELPTVYYKRLSENIKDDVREDIKEAEIANYNQCYKASVTMCRRALQLGLIDRGIKDGRLDNMLKVAHTSKLLTDDTYTFATSVKGFGDIGAHRREYIEPDEVILVIRTAVRILNELFP